MGKRSGAKHNRNVKKEIKVNNLGIVSLVGIFVVVLIIFVLASWVITKIANSYYYERWLNVQSAETAIEKSAMRSEFISTFGELFSRTYKGTKNNNGHLLKMLKCLSYLKGTCIFYSDFEQQMGVITGTIRNNDQVIKLDLSFQSNFDKTGYSFLISMEGISHSFIYEGTYFPANRKSPVSLTSSIVSPSIESIPTRVNKETHEEKVW